MNDTPILKPDPKMLECNFNLKGKINTFIEECKPEFTIMSALRSKNLDLIKKTPQLHFAPGACGSYVVANKEFMKGLIKTYRKLKGLDMEGYGLYMAAHMLGRKALLIKGVSDFADSDKGDVYHRMCSCVHIQVPVFYLNFLNSLIEEFVCTPFPPIASDRLRRCGLFVQISFIVI